MFFGGDAAFGPKNIIWAVAHGHEAAVSIDKMLTGEDMDSRPFPAVEVVRQKRESRNGITIAISHSILAPRSRSRTEIALSDIAMEVELEFDLKLALAEAKRCLNCDVQTVFEIKTVHRMRCLR